MTDSMIYPPQALDLADPPRRGFVPDLARSVRQTRQLSVRELAVVLDLSIQAISAWERGRSAPSPGHLRSLAVALGVRIDDLTSTPADQADLISLRFRAGLTATEVAATLAIQKSVLSVVENGYRRLPDPLIQPLAGVYRRPLEAILAAWDISRSHVTNRAHNASQREAGLVNRDEVTVHQPRRPGSRLD